MKPVLVCLLAAVMVMGPSVPTSGQEKCSPTVTGDLRIEVIDSATYGDKRILRIWLPPAYEAPENAQTRYPVLYLFDGQTLFDTCTAFRGEQELQVDETLTRLIHDGDVPPMIVVGMDSSSRHSHEYRVYRDVLTDPAGAEPRGKDLPAFVVNEVVTHVTQRYRLTNDPTQIGIGGTSLGAIAALYVLMNRGDQFGIGLIESPTLPLGNGQMLRDTAFLARAPDRVAIGVGSAELAVPGGDKFAAQMRMSVDSANAGFVRMAETLATHFRSAYLNQAKITMVVEPNANHTSASWSRRLPRAVTTLFGRERQ